MRGEWKGVCSASRSLSPIYLGSSPRVFFARRIRRVPFSSPGKCRRGDGAPSGAPVFRLAAAFWRDARRPLGAPSRRSDPGSVSQGPRLFFVLPWRRLNTAPCLGARTVREALSASSSREVIVPPIGSRGLLMRQVTSRGGRRTWLHPRNVSRRRPPAEPDALNIIAKKRAGISFCRSCAAVCRLAGISAVDVVLSFRG